MLTMLDTIVGSIAYGLKTPESDVDRKQIATPLWKEYFYGIAKEVPEASVEMSGVDITRYTVHRMAELLKNSNIHILEMLFAPEDCIMEVNPLFKKHFLDVNTKFLSKGILKSAVDYANAEYKKTLGITKKFESNPIRYNAELGYRPSNATHSIRILMSARIALEEGIYPVRLSEKHRDLLMDIKMGKFSKEDYERMYHESLRMIHASYENSKLPDADIRDINFLNHQLVRFYEEFFDSLKA